MVGDLLLHSLDDNIHNLLATFSGWNRSFSLEEISSWADDAIDLSTLRQSFRKDHRFVSLDLADGRTELFIPKHVALQWWASLTVRLGHLGKSRLDISQLANAMNSLHPSIRWAMPSPALIELAQRHGLVAHAWSPGFYVFPLAQLLGRETVAILQYGSRSPLTTRLVEGEVNWGRTSIVAAVESLLDAAGERVGRIIRSREGISPYDQCTLQELGETFGLSRERIRQIELNFWKRLHLSPRRELLRTIWHALVDFARRPGAMVCSVDDEVAPYVCFSAKCLRIPYTTVCDLAILGTSDRISYPQIGEDGWSIVGSDIKELASLLDCHVWPFLERDAIRRVAQAIADGHLGTLRKQDKVYLALKRIGRRAHYSEVAEVYNEMYPEDMMNERNVHAILSRCASSTVEQYGIVWVGTKGTYGLKEHGYVRPAMPLFDTVAKIVKERYEMTRKAVHINVIVTELGRYRHEVHPASLAFATGLNTSIREVEKGYFVPSKAVPTAEPDGNPEHLDRVLREFRESMLESR